MYVGIDGGGTRARALLVDAAGSELARLEGPAGIIDAADPASGAEVAASLVTGIVGAVAGARLPVRALCCGLAGAGRAPEREAVRVALVLSGVAEQVMVVGDAEVAMYDAFGDDPGVLVIAGTGSIAWARGSGGVTARVGGWGRLIGDEGSGFAIGAAAVRAVLRALDGRDPETALTAAVLRDSGCARPEDLVSFTARASKAEIAALTPAVFEAVAAGDRAATRIADEAVAALVELVVTAAGRVGLKAPAVATAGGLIEPGGPLHDRLRTALREAVPAAQVLARTVDAARGAARLAAASHP
ncbi:MAG TPA: BadF/BadG/BcrA/BcrD ATPase family protein [Longimicrobiales bacterium]|nr:BadF/BadG/BcrA/BcrD ATPase family protein [Longimicrobiales bacterium]